MQSFFLIDQILLVINWYSDQIGSIYNKSFEMFLLVENSEIAYFLALSLTNTILTLENPSSDLLGLEII